MLPTAQLIELCNRPLAFRPAYLGGNRLGFILMELRREFMLRGVFPQTLPELPIGTVLFYTVLLKLDEIKVE